MKANLMFIDRDFRITASFGRDNIASDLEINHILSGMARGDKVINEACATAIFRPLTSLDEIAYRQETLEDAFNNSAIVRELYGITLETIKRKKDSWLKLSTAQDISHNLSNAIGLIKIYSEMLLKLRAVADTKKALFKSRSFTNLMNMLQKELSDEFFKEVRTHLDELKESDGVLIRAKLGSYNQGINYTLCRKEHKGLLNKWTFAPSYTVKEKDELGAMDLGKRYDRAVNEVTNALVQAVEHIEGFFGMLQSELAFYIGCLNLRDTLKELGMPACIPRLLPVEKEDRLWSRLYDVSLALTKNEAVTCNELTATDKRLYIVTGANQGGKTTFIRSLGQAQLMAQCGMFVGAESFTAPIRKEILTHFKKEEDSFMKSGKLDEELSRMSKLVGYLDKGTMILFNESFAATNEREGSEIARQITQALIDNGIEVFSVTHLYTFAAAFKEYPKTQYLRAQRLDSGKRTFKIESGEPLETAFGEDLYKKVFKG